MRARTPRAGETAGVSLSAAGAACAEALRSTGRDTSPLVRRAAGRASGQAPLRRQGERTGRGRPTFSARVEAGRGGEAVATKGFQWRRLSQQLPWHKRGTIIMACGSIGRPAQHRVQPTPLSRRGHQATVRAFRLCLQSERVAARLTPTLGGFAELLNYSHSQ
jgi:hypothetical protein